jgi:hypothetical protein
MQSQSAVLKAVETKNQGTLTLTKSVSHKYGRLKSGRGTIKTVVTYSVYLVHADHVQDLHFTPSKASALRMFKSYVNFLC